MIRSQSLAQAPDLAVEIGVGDDPGGEAQALGLPGVDPPPGQDQVEQRLAAADRAQDGRRHHEGQQADADLGQSEDGALPGEGEIRRDGQPAAAGQREARDPRDHGLADTVHSLAPACPAIVVSAPPRWHPFLVVRSLPHLTALFSLLN